MKRSSVVYITKGLVRSNQTQQKIDTNKDGLPIFQDVNGIRWMRIIL
jgi:hypothetical protein